MDMLRYGVEIGPLMSEMRRANDRGEGNTTYSMLARDYPHNKPLLISIRSHLCGNGSLIPYVMYSGWACNGFAEASAGKKWLPKETKQLPQMLHGFQ